MISIDWGQSIINIPRADLTLLSSYSSGFDSGFGAGFGSFAILYSYDLNQFRLELKNLEDDESGMPFPKTHNHNTETTVGGVVLSRVLEILSPYTITFEDGQYGVNLYGANSNISDRTNVNQVSVRSANSAGLITVTSGSGVTQQDKDDIVNGVWAYSETGDTAMVFVLLDQAGDSTMTNVYERVREF
jgi:hypothetical protein